MLVIAVSACLGLAEEGKCVILVSHSPQVAKRCDECYELKRVGKKKG